MSGRGSTNKKGTSGQGSSNQSNQGFSEGAQVGKSNHGEHTGAEASKPQQKTRDQSSNRKLVLGAEEE